MKAVRANRTWMTVNGFDMLRATAMARVARLGDGTWRAIAVYTDRKTGARLQKTEDSTDRQEAEEVAERLLREVTHEGEAPSNEADRAERELPGQMALFAA